MPKVILLLLTFSVAYAAEQPYWERNSRAFEERLHGEARARAMNDKYYLEWDSFESTVSSSCDKVERFFQAHSRVVKAIFTGGSYYVTVLPVLDAADPVISKCKKAFPTIEYITE